MKYLILASTVALLAPSVTLADFCDLVAKDNASSCRVNADKEGAKILGNWLRTKPEMAQSSSGKKGYYTAGTTVAVGMLGVPHNNRYRLTIQCFAGERSMTIDALPYMLGLANTGRNNAFELTFNVDDKAAYTEKWPLNWHRRELQAPSNSQLAASLHRASKLTVRTSGINGNKSDVGYTYAVNGFDSVNSGLCK